MTMVGCDLVCKLCLLGREVVEVSCGRCLPFEGAVEVIVESRIG